MAPFEAVELMGLAVAPLTENQTIAAVLDGVGGGVGGWVCPVNVDVLRQHHESAEVRDLVAGADIVVADGKPLIWASRIAGTPLPERVAGSSLVLTLPARAAGSGAAVFLLGGNEGAASAAAAELGRRNGAATIAGSHCPPLGFEGDPVQRQNIDTALRTAAPDIVFVGLGFPKQDHLITELRVAFPRMWFVSCGISFSFVSGEIQRAPPLLQKLGLEWLHRMAQEPHRLVRRYLVNGIPFTARMFASAAMTRRRSWATRVHR